MIQNEIPPVAPVQQIVIGLRQYYYHTYQCQSLSSRGSDCICWHDEGTGPMPSGYWIDAQGEKRELEWRCKSR